MRSSIPFSLPTEETLNKELQQEQEIILQGLHEADTGTFISEERIMQWVHS